MKIFKLFLTTMLAGTFVSNADATNPKYKNANLPVEERVSDLLSQMTIYEKIGQLNQRSGFDLPYDQTIAKWTEELKHGNIGSILNVTDPKAVNELQKIVMEQSRLGIPLLIARDVIHGYNTVFPIPLGQAASFDDEIVEQGARVAAVEASADGIRWTFAPMMDVSRDARWGRIAESFGEDPYLISRLAVASVKGFQGKDLTAPTSIAACAKHFVGYGAVEGGRDYNSTYLTERQLRNDYLIPFKAASDAGVLTFMSSFNDNDGIPATGNPHLLKDILRNEWGFNGLVVSDWGSVMEMVPHGFASDLKDAAQKAMNAGCDMDMEGYAYIANLKSLVDEGKVNMKDIDKAVANVLRVKFMLGLFENPYVVTPQNVKYSAPHLAIARKAAEESVVLLKNDGTLPLKNVKRVLLTGPLANAPHEQMGTWTFDGDKTHSVTVLDAMRRQFGNDVEIIFEPGLDFSRDRNTSQITKTVEAAKNADVVIAVIGEEAILSGEGHTRADITLPGAQNQLLDALKATGKPLVTVIMAGRPLAIPEVAEMSDAMLYSFHPGTMGGPAIADILFGVVSPSGHLPVSIPRMSGQTPLYYSMHSTGRPAKGTEVTMYEAPIEAGMTSTGCRSYYFDAGFGPLFPFGYGLTYGKFDYTNFTIDKKEYGKSDTIIATFTLTNNGEMEATEVAQLYVRDLVGSITRPVKELKNYRRITLKPGESTQVKFELPISELAFYGIDNMKKVEPGDFTLFIGSNSDTKISQNFTVK